MAVLRGVGACSGAGATVSDFTGGCMCAVQGLEGAAGSAGEAGASPAAGGHGGCIEDGGGVTTIEDLVESLDGRLEEAVYLVGAGKLKEGAKNLGRAKGRSDGWERRGVQVVDEDSESEKCVGEVQNTRSRGRG